jgi:hypothetical protein
MSKGPPTWFTWQGGIGVAEIVAVGMALGSLRQARQARESTRPALVESGFVSGYQ